MAGLDIIPKTVNTIVGPFNTGTPSNPLAPAARSLKRLLEVTPGLLPLQTQNIPSLPFRPELGPIVGSQSQSGVPGGLTPQPYYQGGGSYDAYNLSPSYNPWGVPSWDFSTRSPSYTTPPPQVYPTYSTPVRQDTRPPWEDLTSLATTFLPFLL